MIELAYVSLLGPSSLECPSSTPPILCYRWIAFGNSKWSDWHPVGKVQMPAEAMVKLMRGSSVPPQKGDVL